MSSALQHRGPDEEGLLANDPRAPGLALGMRRLSIIDLPGGHQPAWNEAKDVAVIFNGEIYNYRELRERLNSLGHRFATQSDTEILVHAWEEWGEDCLTELRGMFTFALLDLRKRYATSPLLFLARDPLGIKPLYYTQTPDGFAFASEVRALLAGGTAEQRVSQDALTSYLLFGSVSEPVTLVEGVFSLPPGHRMLLYVPERRRTPRARPWWDPTRSPAARDTKKPKDFASAAQRLRPLLEDAVRAHLIADVPVGLFLSSGLDSSAIAALAARAQPNIWSFTLAFPGTPYDEAPLARVVAERCGTRHREIPLDAGAVLERLDQALAALDQPTMDGINTYFVSWAAREVGLKVALSGIGGDELFAGYSTFADTPKTRTAHAAGMVCSGPFAANAGTFGTRPACATQQSGWGPQSNGRVVIAGRITAPIFFHTHDVSGVLSAAVDRTSLSPQHRQCGWRDAGTDLAGLARACGGHRAKTGAYRRGVVVGDAVVYGQHASARYRFGEHGAIAGGPGAAAGYAAGGVCRIAAGYVAKPGGNAEGTAGRSAGRYFAGRSSCTAEAHVYFALGRMVARAFAGATGAQLC